MGRRKARKNSRQDRALSPMSGVCFGLVVAVTALVSQPMSTARAAAGRDSSTSMQAGATPQAKTESKPVRFPGHGVTLAGTLLVPPATAKAPRASRRPAVLLVGEEGTSTRDGYTVGKATHQIYLEIAEGLAAAGIPSFRFDRRCQGESECRQPQSFDDLIDDTYAALRFLGAQPGIDATRLVIVGHGEGGYLGMCLLSQKEGAAAGLVTINTSGRTLGKMVREEFQARMQEEGLTPAQIKPVLARTERIMRQMAYGAASLSSEDLDPSNRYDAELLRRMSQHPMVVGLLVNDPLQIISSVRVPILLLQGEKDVRVTLRDVGFLEESLNRTNHPDFAVRTFSEMDHWMKANSGAPSFAAEEDSTRPFEKGLIPTLLEWWATRFADRPRR
jgi:pimeloyl-ACP methyl ester carboxylesterase